MAIIPRSFLYTPFPRLHPSFPFLTLVFITDFLNPLKHPVDILLFQNLFVTSINQWLMTLFPTNRRTGDIIHFLLLFTINRGVLVAVAQLGFLSTYLGAPSKIYWWVIEPILDHLSCYSVPSLAPFFMSWVLLILYRFLTGCHSIWVLANCMWTLYVGVLF